MSLSTIDWVFIGVFFLISLAIGIYASRKAGKSSSEFFLSGRNMPWWLLGVSMVATTFSADTPNLVTDLVRKDGVAGNWVWWAFLLTGMMTVFVYSRLWRRSGVVTDLEFYEMRYSGGEAAFLRGFRAIYLGVIFNILIMASVCMAGIKIGGVLLGISPVQTLLLASVVTVAYSVLGGLRGILLTDFFQFIIAMIGTIWAAVVIVNLPEIGGLGALVTHENVVDKIALLPSFHDRDIFVALLVIPLAVQWWAAYYPGAEPGGGGYIAQRMLAAKDEKNALAATLFFNIAHYALRPWPWILIALASLVVFPDLASIKTAFPDISDSILDDDLAYPAMLSYLPKGLLGIVIASLIAAFMSTISTHLNWGSSYMANDVFRRFIKPDASEKDLVLVGRVSTVLMMICAAVLALFLQSAKQVFDIIVLLGAGTGLLYILRWFWWRINAYSEITAMVVSFLVAITFKFILVDKLSGAAELLLGVGITTVAWIAVTFLTRPTDQKVLQSFYQKIRPHSAGWKPVVKEALQHNVITADQVTTGKFPRELAMMFAGVFFVYSTLFCTGYILYGNGNYALVSGFVALVSGLIIWRNWSKV